MKFRPWSNPVPFILITLVSIIIGRIIEYFIHESGHFATAWMMGITMTPDPMQAIITTPIHITRYQTGIYGFSESFQYIPYMSGLDVSSASMTAIGGLLFNALAAVLCFWIFLKSRGIKYKSLMTLSLWVLIFNLGALFSYIPMRVFEVTGDVGFFLSSLSVHPVIFLFPTLILIAAGLIIYFSVILPLYCLSIPVKNKFLRFFILLCSTIILFMYMAGPISTELRISDIMTLPEMINIFPVLVIGQCIFLIALLLVGLLRLNSLQSSRYLGAKKKVA